MKKHALTADKREYNYRRKLEGWSLIQKPTLKDYVMQIIVKGK